MPPMEFRLDRDLPIPLGTQLRGSIEFGIGFGELRPGARLPWVRGTADLLGVALDGGPGPARHAFDYRRTPGPADVRRVVDPLLAAEQDRSRSSLDEAS